MKNILTWLAVLALVAVALSAELPLLKSKGLKGEGGEEDLKTASSFIGPLYGWGYPYWGKGFGWGGGWGWGGIGYPYWG